MSIEEGRDYGRVYGRECHASSKENLLPTPGAMSLQSVYSETSIRQIDKEDVVYILRGLLQKVQDEGLPPVNHYKGSGESRIYDNPELPPPRRKVNITKRSLNRMLKTLLVACIILVALLLGVIAIAIYFYFSLGCVPAEHVLANHTAPKMGGLTGRLPDPDTEIHCCCDMCRDHSATVFREDGSKVQRNNLTTPASTKDQFDRSHGTDVCVFGSACARVGIGIPEELNHCADLTEHSYLTLNDSLENRQRQNRKGIKIHNNSSLDIKTTGLYMVHSRLAYNPNCSQLCPASRNKNFIHKVYVYRIPDRRDNRKDQIIELLSIEHKCCTDCRDHSGISFVMGLSRLLKTDDVFIKTTGPELIKYSHVSSYLEVVLLKEGDEES